MQPRARVQRERRALCVPERGISTIYLVFFFFFFFFLIRHGSLDCPPEHAHFFVISHLANRPSFSLGPRLVRAIKRRIRGGGHLIMTFSELFANLESFRERLVVASTNENVRIFYRFEHFFSLTRHVSPSSSFTSRFLLVFYERAMQSCIIIQLTFAINTKRQMYVPYLRLNVLRL